MSHTDYVVLGLMCSLTLANTINILIFLHLLAGRIDHLHKNDKKESSDGQ